MIIFAGLYNIKYYVIKNALICSENRLIILKMIFNCFLNDTDTRFLMVFFFLI